MQPNEREWFEAEMERMAADPGIRAVNEELFRALGHLDSEALPPPLE